MNALRHKCLFCWGRRNIQCHLYNWIIQCLLPPCQSSMSTYHPDGQTVPGKRFSPALSSEWPGLPLSSLNAVTLQGGHGHSLGPGWCMRIHTLQGGWRLRGLEQMWAVT